MPIAVPPVRLSPLLFQRFPPLADRLAWTPLTRGPTPVTPLDAFSLERLFVKRDDRTSPLYGGNKVRKLEWLLGRARARGKAAVLTFGAWGSHHAYATALFAREVGLRASLILYPQPVTPHVLEMLAADRAADARIWKLPHMGLVPAGTALATLAHIRRGEGTPFVVAPGGSDAVGTLGYVECGLEIADDVRAGRLPPPDLVYAAAGTCGTIAGLALGLSLGGLSRARVVGVRVVPPIVASAARIRGLIEGAGALLEAVVPGAARRACPVDLVTDQLGRGYGHATPAAEAAQEAAQRAGLETETTYTAKALAGLAAHARGGGRERLCHLYVHTLGALQASAPRSPAGS